MEAVLREERAGCASPKRPESACGPSLWQQAGGGNVKVRATAQRCRAAPSRAAP